MLGIILLALFIFYCGIMAVRFGRVNKLIKTNKSFPTFYVSNKNPSKHILLLGDSSMYGAGIEHTKKTFGALIASKENNATVEVLAENSAKVSDLVKQIEKARYNQYGYIVIGIGANDIMFFSNYKTLQKRLLTFLQQTSKITDHIILCHSVNIGNVGFFLFPFDYVFDYRTEELSKVYAELAKKVPRVTYLNFYRKRGNDYYDKKTRKKFVARDGAHPSDYANQFFFNIIWDAIQNIEKQK